MKKLIPEDGTLDVSQRRYDTVTLLLFSPFVEAILSDLLLRVDNLRPQRCHCADVFLDVMSWQKGADVCSNISDLTQLVSIYKLLLFKVKLCCVHRQHQTG